jgi:hypothetical protein
MSKTRRWLVLATVSAGLLMVSVDTTLAITAIALAAGSAFTYRYLNRQPATPAEQAQHATEGIGTAGVKTA